MKQLYFFLAAMLIGTFATAQGLLPAQTVKDGFSFKKALDTSTQIDRDAFWSNDCDSDSCSNWVFDNGSDIEGSAWFGIDLNFECTTDGPSGPYNDWVGGEGDGSAASSMNSTTSFNGTLMVDSDMFGADANYDANWVENSWVQTAEAIDCSGQPFVTMSFETRYQCWDGGNATADLEKCLIEISRDGINWPDISTSTVADGTVDYGDGPVQSRWEAFPEFVSKDVTDNPSIVEIDITSAAADQSTIWLRFRWVGTWGYSWEIDDIQMYPTPANDTRIEDYLSYTNYNQTGVYEYGSWPESQIPTNLEAGAKVYSVGYETQTGVSLELDHNGIVEVSQSIDLAYQANDTLVVPYQPSGLGAIAINYTLSADVEDENPSNNTGSQGFEITELSFGRDNGFITNAYPSEPTDDFIAVAGYDIESDVTIYAIDVAIINGYDNGTSCIAYLFDVEDPDYLSESSPSSGGVLVQSQEVDLSAGNGNNAGEDVATWYTFLLEEPFDASAGDFLAGGFESYGGSNLQIGEAQYTYDNTAFVYGDLSSGYGWYYTNEVPMIRLNLDPNAEAGVADLGNTQGFEMFPSYPNPTNSITKVKFNLDNASDVKFEMLDITGKAVYTLDMGTQAPGMNNITIDASEFAAGAYTYTLTVNGERATDRLMVN
jgi:hypothetical protein